MRAFAALLATALVGACDRPTGTRSLRFTGAPSCPAGATYARPLVVRVDRDRALFDEPFTAEVVLAAPSDPATIEVPRERLRLTLRVGACTATSLATWDCKAASWLATAPIELDARAGEVDAPLPTVVAPCVRPPRR